MSKKWSIVYYEIESGVSPVYDFIESLSAKAQAKITHTFDLLEKFGVFLGYPHIKKVTGTLLWELRILGGDSIRIFYVVSQGRKFVLLHGFIKKGRKTKKKDIKIAEKRLKNITKL